MRSCHVRMPFGKHRGTLISELPDEYIAWLYECADLYGPLELAVDEEFRLRFEPEEEEDRAPHERVVLVEQLNLDPLLRSVCSKLIEVGYRHLALKNHPDVGGDERAMRSINNAIEVLRRAVGQRHEP